MFISDDGVFSKSTLDFGSRVLLETIIDFDLKGKLLDLGCGLGYMGVLLKKYHPDLDVTMLDINATAVELAKENSKLYRQENTVIESDGITDELGKFNVIVCNPPIRTGKQNIYKMLQQALNHLEDDGCLYIVMKRQQGAESAIKHFKELYKVEVINKENGYWVISLSH